MSAGPMWRRYLRFRGPDPAADLEDELAFHLEMRAREYEARGMDPAAARAEAERRFGDARRVRRECEAEDRRKERSRRAREGAGVLLGELRLAARALRRAPGFTAVAVLTLGVGIGVNTALFSVVNGVLLRPLPFPEPDRLVELHSVWQGRPATASPPDFTDWGERTTAFAATAAYHDDGFALTGGGEAAESVPGTRVTPGFFSVLGVAPALGGAFVAENGVPGGEAVAVLGHDLWQRRFGGDPGVVGGTVELDGVAHRVLGVMPRGFAFPRTAELWVPLAFTAEDLTTQRGAHYLSVLGRLRDGVDVGRADRELSALAARLEEAHPRSNAGYGAGVVGLREAMVGEVRPALLVLLGAVALVLLIACANVANLLLVRAVAREREMAVRAALGAGRRRLVLGLLAESLLLAGAGAGVGLLLAVGATRLLARLHPESIPRLDEVAVDGAVLGYTLAAALATGLAFGLLPALRASGAGASGVALREGGRGATPGRRTGRLSAALVVGEIALAVALLAGAGLLVRSLARLQAVEPGFSPERVLTFSVTPPERTYESPERVRAFHASLLERVRALPGVESAGAIFGLPLSGFHYYISLHSLDGVPMGDSDLTVQVRVVEPGFLETMGIPLRRGRALSGEDRRGAPRAVMVNEAAARLLWPGEDPLGRSLLLGTRLVDSLRAGGEVVGVVGDVRDLALEAEARPQVYLSHDQFPVRYLGYAVRTSGEPMALAGAVRRELEALDPGVPMAEVRPMEAWLAESTGRRRFYLLLLGAFAATALGLAAVGIYGVMSYVVRQRVHEIGVRMALGARAGDVLRLMLARGMAPALAGVALGVVLALLLSRALEGLLFDLSPRDPAALAGGVAILLGAALLACWLPARRATRVEPMEAIGNRQ